MENPTQLKSQQRVYELFQFSKRPSSTESHNTDTNSHSRIATIYQDNSGEARGVAIWIDSSELKLMGIDLTSTTAIKLHVTEDGICLAGASKHI
jgi:hypothetical protein